MAVGMSPGVFSPLNPRIQLLWDASALAMTADPLGYQLGMLEGWRSPGRNEHLIFGSLVHSALERWDITTAIDGPTEAAMEEVVKHALTESWGWVSTDRKKNRYTLIRAVVWYMLDAMEGQGAMVKPALLPDGRPAVESQLRMPLFESEWGLVELVANVDGFVTFGGELFVRERKTSGGRESQWAIHPQPDTYDLVAHHHAKQLWGDHRYTGVLMETVATGVGFSRWDRKVETRTDAQRAEWAAEAARVVRSMWWYVEQEDGGGPRDWDDLWPMRRVTYAGAFKPRYLDVISRPPHMRRALLRQNYERRPHDPLRPGDRDVQQVRTQE